jgi:AcrR family transcriptional regulator
MSPRVTPENRIPDICRAAIAVFSRNGFRLTQMEEIAKEAKVAKATLYYYFKSKVHLFHYVLEIGLPLDDAPMPPPESSKVRTESDLLRLLTRKLKEGSRLQCITEFLGRNDGEIDLENELAQILEGLWDVCEHNRIQIIILEKSAIEFPEMARTYDEYARKQILGQIEAYLADRMRSGTIRPLNSVRATARFLTEALAWFGFKQFSDPFAPIHPKSEVLPDVVAVLTNGLKP